MELLISGLIIFFAIHLLPSFQGLRNSIVGSLIVYVALVFLHPYLFGVAIVNV